jgi:hypothetical protein
MTTGMTNPGLVFVAAIENSFCQKAMMLTPSLTEAGPTGGAVRQPQLFQFDLSCDLFAIQIQKFLISLAFSTCQYPVHGYSGRKC